MKQDKGTSYLSSFVTLAKTLDFSSVMSPSSDSELVVDKRDPLDIVK